METEAVSAHAVPVLTPETAPQTDANQGGKVASLLASNNDSETAAGGVAEVRPRDCHSKEALGPTATMPTVATLAGPSATSLTPSDVSMPVAPTSSTEPSPLFPAPSTSAAPTESPSPRKRSASSQATRGGSKAVRYEHRPTASRNASSGSRVVGQHYEWCKYVQIDFKSAFGMTPLPPAKQRMVGSSCCFYVQGAPQVYVGRVMDRSSSSCLVVSDMSEDSDVVTLWVPSRDVYEVPPDEVLRKVRDAVPALLKQKDAVAVGTLIDTSELRKDIERSLQREETPCASADAKEQQVVPPQAPPESSGALLLTSGTVLPQKDSAPS